MEHWRTLIEFLDGQDIWSVEFKPARNGFAYGSAIVRKNGNIEREFNNNKHAVRITAKDYIEKAKRGV